MSPRLIKLLVVLALYLAFTTALYLGLQVDPLYGNIGLVVVAVLAIVLVYFGFLRKN